MTAEASTVIGDRYRLDERLAVGGMGEIWRAHDNVLDRAVAIKILRSEYAGDSAFRARFQDEARHTAGLSHPGIATLYDYGLFDDRPYLVMELVTGEPLSVVVQRDAPLSAERALDIVGQAGLALQAAHDAGVVHRDVKPGNLLITADGAVKVTDFGIARAAASAAPSTGTGLVIGTAAYLSPEQASGRGAQPASDVYALGVVAYECLAGRRPFDGDSAVGVATAHVNTPPPPLPDTVPPLVSDFVMRALEKDPARRQPSAGDFGRTALALAAELRSAQPAGQPAQVAESAAPRTAVGTPFTAVTSAPERPATERPARTWLGRPWWLVLAAVAVLILVVVLALHSCGGSSIVKVPDERGRAYPAAARDLHDRGLLPTATRQSDPSAPKGTVIQQRPAAGTKLASGQPVVLVVSTGPKLVHVDASAYIGRPADEVVAALENKHLQVHTINAVAAVPPGTVTAVDPTGSVREGTTVTVTVAAPAEEKPKPAEKPPPEGHAIGHDH